MIVVDASCVIEVLLQTPDAAMIETHVMAHRPLHAPEVVDLEVLQVLRRLVRAREISAERGELAVTALDRLALRRWPHAMLRRRIWALRDRVTAYDAAYLALAERLECVFVTRDQRIARAVGRRTRVEVV